MRWISKLRPPPSSITDYLSAQTNVGHGLDYKTFASTGAPGGGSRGRQLCRELTTEQCGLCAYTGAGIDSRLGALSDPQARLKFSAHNEHLKPQSECRAELLRAGKTPGMDLGEDMDHRNMVAALLVSGGDKRVTRNSLFGAAHRENETVGIIPTDCNCEQRFMFDINGGIHPTTSDDQAAVDTIAALNLGHETLPGWRAQAIAVFVEGIETRADAERIVASTTNAENGWLPEYCFVIRQVVQHLLTAIP
jgi:hypothetical protein